MTTASEAMPAQLKGMSKVEFIVLMAFLMAINALAIDIMLPGLQEIGASLGVENENHRQYVVSAYLIGLGIAQLLYGPLSDRFGRRVPMLVGIVIYVISALVIVLVPSFTALLVLRFIQGIGSAATRVVTVSIVRDAFGGRRMAEVMSLIMMVFMVVPVVAVAVEFDLVLGARVIVVVEGGGEAFGLEDEVAHRVRPDRKLPLPFPTLLQGLLHAPLQSNDTLFAARVTFLRAGPETAG